MFEQADLPLAASLASLSGRQLTHKDVAATLIRQLDHHYQAIRDSGSAPLEAVWKRRLNLVGTNVLVEAVDGQHRGSVRDLTLAGLDLEIPNGNIVKLIPEAIRHIHRAD